MSRYAADDGRLVYVGNLPSDIRERELDDLFHKYGRIRNIDIKTPRRPPPFAFIEFDDRRDAQDAVRGRNGYDFAGDRLRVEVAKGRRERDERPPRERKEFRARNTGYRVVVKGLPDSASWQDLKDFMRPIIKPVYTDVIRERDGVIGIAGFDSKDDMNRIIDKLDDTEFKNSNDRAYVRLYEDKENDRDRSRSRSRSRSPRGRRSRSYSPRGRSPPRSRSPEGASPPRGGDDVNGNAPPPENDDRDGGDIDGAE